MRAQEQLALGKQEADAARAGSRAAARLPAAAAARAHARSANTETSAASHERRRDDVGDAARRSQP